MRRTLLPLLLLASCGAEEVLEADRDFFLGQRFDCDPATPAPTCPPFACRVEPSGAVVDCDRSGCPVDNDATAFEGPEGVDLCVPARCVVEAEGAAPACTFDRCSPDDVTIYTLEFSCP